MNIQLKRKRLNNCLTKKSTPTRETSITDGRQKENKGSNQRIQKEKIKTNFLAKYS